MAVTVTSSSSTFVGSVGDDFGISIAFDLDDTLRSKRKYDCMCFKSVAEHLAVELVWERLGPFCPFVGDVLVEDFP